MATKDISDIQVCEAIRDRIVLHVFATDLLEERTGECHKVCVRALERACRRCLIDWGVSLRTAWLTEKGIKLLHDHEKGKANG